MQNNCFVQYLRYLQVLQTTLVVYLLQSCILFWVPAGHYRYTFSFGSASFSSFRPLSIRESIFSFWSSINLTRRCCRGQRRCSRASWRAGAWGGHGACERTSARKAALQEAVGATQGQQWDRIQWRLAVVGAGSITRSCTKFGAVIIAEIVFFFYIFGFKINIIYFKINCIRYCIPKYTVLFLK